ncbi:MAG: peptidylprolyl isomerase [Rickettsiaceae bacterium]|nr:peptidylprolyl isomerase [Rickettsiaceae bacterium]
MRKLAIVFLSATLSTSSILSSAFANNNEATTEASNKKDVVATYIGGDVTSTDVMTQFGPMLAAQGNPSDKKFSEFDKNLQEMLVKTYIHQKLLEKEAEKSGIRNSTSFKEKMKTAASQLLQQEFIENYLKTAVTDAMIDAEYTKIAEKLKGQKEIKTSHILVDTEEKSKEIKKKLNKGSKFEELVKEFSKDEGSKANGGELAYTRKGQLVPEYESKAFSMKKDEISDPVKSQFGWHIIRVLDIRDIKIPSKEEVEREIRGKLSSDAIEAYVAKLAEKANVQYKL